MSIVEVDYTLLLEDCRRRINQAAGTGLRGAPRSYMEIEGVGPDATRDKEDITRLIYSVYGLAYEGVNHTPEELIEGLTQTLVEAITTLKDDPHGPNPAAVVWRRYPEIRPLEGEEHLEVSGMKASLRMVVIDEDFQPLELPQMDFPVRVAEGAPYPVI